MGNHFFLHPFLFIIHDFSPGSRVWVVDMWSQNNWRRPSLAEHFSRAASETSREITGFAVREGVRTSENRVMQTTECNQGILFNYF